jgi:hypothetical protein
VKRGLAIVAFGLAAAFGLSACNLANTNSDPFDTYEKRLQYCKEMGATDVSRCASFADPAHDYFGFGGDTGGG